MNQAGRAISDSVSGALHLAAMVGDIGLLKKFDVGSETHFIQPVARNERVVEEHSIAAPVALVVIGLIVLVSVIATMASMNFSKTLTPIHIEDNDQDTPKVIITNEADENIDPRSETGTHDGNINYMSTTQYSSETNYSFDPLLLNNSVRTTNPNVLFRDNNNGGISNKILKESGHRSIGKAYLNCFNITQNLRYLIIPKRNDDDHHELDVFEAIKTLSFIWGI